MGLSAEFDSLDAKFAALEGEAPGRGRRRASPSGVPTMGRLQGELARLLELLQGADAVPTTQAEAAVAEVKKDLDGMLARWTAATQRELVELNAKLKAAGQGEINP
jgi:hypothetical protein